MHNTPVIQSLATSGHSDTVKKVYKENLEWIM